MLAKQRTDVALSRKPLSPALFLCGCDDLRSLPLKRGGTAWRQMESVSFRVARSKCQPEAEKCGKVSLKNGLGVSLPLLYQKLFVCSGPLVCTTLVPALTSGYISRSNATAFSLLTLLLVTDKTTEFQSVIEVILNLMFVVKSYQWHPAYLSKILFIPKQSRALWSSGQLLLEVLRSRCKRWQGRAFSVAAPKLE